MRSQNAPTLFLKRANSEEYFINPQSVPHAMEEKQRIIFKWFSIDGHYTKLPICVIQLCCSGPDQQNPNFMSGAIPKWVQLQ